jgi:hypothetical protein
MQKSLDASTNTISQFMAMKRKYLCGQILNEALVEEPDNDAAKNYKAKNHELILKEVT